MKSPLILSGFMIMLLFFSAISSSPQVHAAPEHPQVISAFGKIPGQDLYAHVIVVVPPGADKKQTVGESLRQQGLKPFDSLDFSTTGMVHDQFRDGTSNPVFIQNYNPANDPTEGQIGHSILKDSQIIWNEVPSSNFVFMQPDATNNLITDRCPSLVKECPGRQVTDSFNDVAWMSIKDRNTLGVTWYSTNADEADMALNTNFTWKVNSNAPNTFDPLTVLIHENGHVLGLGHSEVQGTIMEAIYEGVRQTLHNDDICGIQTLYGTPDPTICNTTSEPPGEPGTGDATTAEVTYNLKSKGRNAGLQISVTLTDNASPAQPVSNSLVEIELILNQNGVITVYGPVTDDTNSEGKAQFILKNPVPSGSYTTKVLTVDGQTWPSSQTTDPGFTK